MTSSVGSWAFALLGPFEPWMEATNGLRLLDDIGGPMDLTDGYRWNVPVVTYGFDQSFLDFFGTNGVAAVAGAIQILNDLPPASETVPTNYPLGSQRANLSAITHGLYDLKSQTLSLLLEQMGLAQPTRYIFVLRQWDPVFLTAPSESEWPAGTIPTDIVQRNFDPQTLSPDIAVNQTQYSGYVESGSPTTIQAEFNSPVGYGNAALPVQVNTIYANLSVADATLNPGKFYTGLTYDDVGGLKYLLSTNNVRYETLLPGVVGTGTNTGSFVNGAWRPGVDKITFVPQPVDAPSGAFLPLTNCFTDNYLADGVWRQQQLARVITQPDFIFCAGDARPDVLFLTLFTRSGTDHWLNNAAANGNIDGAGPGVIQPQVRIVFNKLGSRWDEALNGPVLNITSLWASYDATTNAPVIYPIPQPGTNRMTVRMWVWFPGRFQKSIEWKADSLPGAIFALQTTPDLVHWPTLCTVTNNGSICTFLNQEPAGTAGFYRLIPQ